MKRFLFLVLLYSAMSAIAILTRGPQTTVIPAASRITITNETTNLYYLTSLSFTFSNNAVATSVFEAWWKRGIISNQFIMLSYTNTTNVFYFPAGRIYLGQWDKFEFINRSTNNMYFNYTLDL